MSNEVQNKRKKGIILAVVFVAIGIAYAVSPIDIIPDLIFIAGWIDDVAVNLGMIAAAVTAIVKSRK